MKKHKKNEDIDEVLEHVSIEDRLEVEGMKEIVQNSGIAVHEIEDNDPFAQIDFDECISYKEFKQWLKGMTWEELNKELPGAESNSLVTYSNDPAIADGKKVLTIQDENKSDNKCYVIMNEKSEADSH